MPETKVRGPDGNVITVRHPDGASREQIINFAKEQSGPGTVMKVQTDLPPADMGAGASFVEGLAQPIQGAAQLYQHTLGTTEGAKAADAAINQRERQFQERGGSEIARGLGRVTAALPAMAAAGPIGGIPGAIAGGVLSEAVNPVPGDDYWKNKTTDVLLSGAFGAAGVGGATKAAGNIVGGAKGAARELADAGVQLTPGQVGTGGVGIVRRAEEALDSVPILGSFIKSARGRSIETFNQAAINQALEPIGVALPKGVVAGHQAIKFGHDQLDKAYDTLLPQMQLTLDQNLASDISNVRFQASSALTAERAGQLDKILKDRFARYFNNTGSIPGNELKRAESDLGQIASNYRGSPNGDERALAGFIDDIKASIRDALSRQNPQQAAQLQKINQAYAMFARIETAAARVATKEGVFAPADLLAAVKGADKTVRKSAFARGDALFQDFAELGQKILPSKLPNSGTADRAQFAGAVAGAGYLLHNPLIPAAIGTATLPYTKVGGQVVNRIARAGPTQQAAGQFIKKTAPFTGTAGSQFFPDPLSTEDPFLSGK